MTPLRALLALTLLSIWLLPANAQDLSLAERARLEEVIQVGYRQYETAAGESPGARENYAHVRRMVDAIASRRAELARRGIDADVARAGVLFSDLGKNPANLSGLAQELFPREFAQKDTRGQAMFRPRWLVASRRRPCSRRGSRWLPLLEPVSPRSS